MTLLTNSLITSKENNLVQKLMNHDCIPELKSLNSIDAFTRFTVLLRRNISGDPTYIPVLSAIEQWENKVVTDPAGFGFMLRVYLWLRYQDEMIADTQALLRFKTTQTDVPNNMNPEIIKFGEFLKIRAESLDLQFCNYLNHAFEIRAGVGTRPVGLYAHCDVVPALENNWNYGPFKGILNNGNVYGRGAVDNKSPITSVLYVMRAMKDTGLRFEIEPVLVVGTAEESSWDGIDYYIGNADVPETSIVMDNTFPVVFAEKGILNVHITHPVSGLIEFDRSPWFLRSFEGGTVSNQVPSDAEAIISMICEDTADADSYLEGPLGCFRDAHRNSQLTYRFQSTGDMLFHATGCSSHAADPEKGHNALWDLIRFITEELKVSGGPEIHLLEFLGQHACSDWLGKQLGLEFEDDVMGPLTVNLGYLKREQDLFVSILNIRYPRGRTDTDIGNILQELLDDYNLKHGARLHMELREGLAPIYISREMPLVRKLQQAYTEVTGRHDPPESCAGTTYAKVLPNAVGFGPMFPGCPSRAHTANEYVSLEELHAMSGLYMTALLHLSSDNGAEHHDT